MTENEIKKELGCPTDRELKEHIKIIKSVIEAQNRERIAHALSLLDGFVPQVGLLTDKQMNVAAGVFKNQEFEKFILSSMDNVRNKAVLDETSECIRGHLIAFSDTYKFFKNAYNSTKK